MAFVAAEGAKVMKTDTKQAYLYGDIGVDVVYFRPPDWWPEQIPEEHKFLLLRAFMVRGRLPVNGIFISTWMEKNGYEAMNNEKTVFMKNRILLRKGLRNHWGQQDGNIPGHGS